MPKTRFLALAGLFALTPALAQERAPDAPAPIPETILSKAVTANIASTDQQLLNADADQDNWLLHGRTYDNQRFSPLTQINRENVKRLAIKAIIHTGQINSTEATPIVVDGILYVSTPLNHVQAYDATTGELKWSYNPVLGFTDNCCGPQSRGVAVAYGKVFVAQLDGHVVALDARTGAVVWKSVIADTIPAPSHYYAFTLAPQVFNGMVLVGNSGAEYPTRGFVQALDANNGKLIWRFYTTAAPASRAAIAGVKTAGSMAAARSGTRPPSIPRTIWFFSPPAIPIPITGARTARATTPIPIPSSPSIPAPANCAGGTSKCRMTCGTMTVPRR
jgi:glucose dehydrogenase